AGLAKNSVELGNLVNQPVGELEDAGGFTDRHAGNRRGHEKNRALIERRHELFAQALEGNNRRGQDDRGGKQREPAEAQHEPHERPVDPDEETVDRIAGLRRDLAADEKGHEHGHKRHAEQGSKGHGKRLGEGQRLEEPALLRLEGENRNEADRDDEERKEQRTSDAARGGDDEVETLAAVRFAAVGLAEMIELLVGVFDHDDGGVDHGADGDGDAAERHDVRGQPQPVHGHESQHDGDGEGDDGHEGRAHMPKKNQADKGDDQTFLEQFFPQGRDGIADELAPVVGGNDFHAGGQGRGDLLQLFLHAVDDGERILAVAHDDDAADHLALAIQLGHAAAQVRTEVHRADIFDVNRRAVHRAERNIFNVGEALDVSAPTDVEFGRPDREDLAPNVVVRPADFVHHVGDGDTVGQELVRIEIDLVFLDEAADGRDLGHARHRLEGIAQMPVLNRAELGQVMFAGLVRQGVFVDPAHAGGVRADDGVDAFRQRAADGIEIFDHPRARPVDIGAVLEDDIDE